MNNLTYLLTYLLIKQMPGNTSHMRSMAVHSPNRYPNNNVFWITVKIQRILSWLMHRLFAEFCENRLGRFCLTNINQLMPIKHKLLGACKN